MKKENSYINVAGIREMLYNDETYIQEFAEAAVQSFGEFSTNYKKYLLIRDETNFRKAGHKIKPVALMMGVDEIVEEYEHAKTLLHQEKDAGELKKSAEKINRITDQVISELKLLC